jgi:predicted O-methyltransferase YrrM
VIQAMRGAAKKVIAWVAVSRSGLRRSVLEQIVERDPQMILEVLGPKLARNANLDDIPLDLDPHERLRFEDLGGLLASTSLDHGVAALTVRQLAYLYGLANRMPAWKAIEIGRFRGGATIAIAAGMPLEGRLWSIDVGAKEARFGQGGRCYDDQIRDFAARFSLPVEIVVGDSRQLDFETGEVDLVFIDGDHAYEVVRSDFERWGRRVRVGGAVLLDDAYSERLFSTFDDDVRRVLQEAVDTGEFREVKRIDRMAHLERIRN